MCVRDVGGAHDFVGQAVDLLLLIPGTVGVGLHIQRGGEHLRRQFFGILSRRVFRLAIRMMLAEVSIGVAVGRNGDSD